MSSSTTTGSAGEDHTGESLTASIDIGRDLLVHLDSCADIPELPLTNTRPESQYLNTIVSLP